MKIEKPEKKQNPLFNFCWYLTPLLCILLGTEGAINVAFLQAIFGYLLLGIVAICATIVLFVLLFVGESQAEAKDAMIKALKKENYTNFKFYSHHLLGWGIASLYASGGHWAIAFYWGLSSMFCLLFKWVILGLLPQEKQ